ncbi:hypothetical protein D3C72_2146960 [compost metagenome]
MAITPSRKRMMTVSAALKYPARIPRIKPASRLATTAPSPTAKETRAPKSVRE